MGKTVYTKVEEMKIALKGLELTNQELIQQIYKRIGCDSRTVNRVLEIINQFDMVTLEDGKYKFK